MSHSQDPDDLWGDAPVARIEITCRRNGSMTVAGHIEDKVYALAMLDNARDAVLEHHANKGGIVTNQHSLCLKTFLFQEGR